MGGFLVHWLVTGLALAVAEWILPGVHITSIPALVIAALVLGFVNAVVRPVMTLLTLPITVITLGNLALPALVFLGFAGAGEAAPLAFAEGVLP